MNSIISHGKSEKINSESSDTSRKKFKGITKLDVRDSKPDWNPYLLKKASEGSPNILIVLYDDTELAAWSSFGGGINMPTLQKLADSELTYSQRHTTDLCSHTPSTFLTYRNHHFNGMACITAGVNDFPGAYGRLPAQCATNHNVPEQDVSSGASRSEWPLQKGFDRFYGLLDGKTNQWYPDLEIALYHKQIFLIEEIEPQKNLRT